MISQNAGKKIRLSAGVGLDLGLNLGVGLQGMGDLGLLEIMYHDTKKKNTPI